MNEKSFFVKLYELFENSSWSWHILASHGTLTITMLPNIKADVPPIIISGKPEEFDMEFFDKLSGPIPMIGMQLQGFEELQAAIEKEKKKAADSTKSKKETPKAQKPANPKPEPKPEESQGEEFPDDDPETDTETDSMGDDLDGIQQETPSEEITPEETFPEEPPTAPAIEEKPAEKKSLDLFDIDI